MVPSPAPLRRRLLRALTAAASLAALAEAGRLVREYRVPGIGPTEGGRHAGGDRYITDGKISMGVLKSK